MGDFMNIVLNTNELGFLPFLSTPVDTFVVGLEGFCANQKYCLNLNDLHVPFFPLYSLYFNLNSVVLSGKILENSGSLGLNERPDSTCVK